ncbi:unnamed protein product, partial [Callosobruchus maculatus]
CSRISSEFFQCLSDFVCSDKCFFDFFRPKVTINKQESGELIDLSSVLITRIFSSSFNTKFLSNLKADFILVYQMPSHHKCAVKDFQDRVSVRHRFPNPRKCMTIFKLWMNSVGNEILQHLNPIYLSTEQIIGMLFFFGSSRFRILELYACEQRVAIQFKGLEAIQGKKSSLPSK